MFSGTIYQENQSLEMIMFSNIKMKYFDSFKPQGIYKKPVLYVMVSTVM